MRKAATYKTVTYLSLRFNDHFPGGLATIWYWLSRYQNVSILDFTGAEGDGGGVDNWS